MTKWKARGATQEEVHRLVDMGWDIDADGDPREVGVQVLVDDETSKAKDACDFDALAFAISGWKRVPPERRSEVLQMLSVAEGEADRCSASPIRRALEVLRLLAEFNPTSI